MLLSLLYKIVGVLAFVASAIFLLGTFTASPFAGLGPSMGASAFVAGMLFWRSAQVLDRMDETVRELRNLNAGLSGYLDINSAHHSDARREPTL